MVKRKVTIECSIGMRPDKNSILFITTVECLDLDNAIEIAIKRAMQVNCIKKYQGYQLVSIEEMNE